MSVKSKLQDWTRRLGAARSALAEVHTLDAELRAEHARMLKERDRIVQAPPPIAELLASMESLVETTAARWLKDNASALIWTLGPGLRREPDGSLVPQPPRFPYDLEMKPLDLAALAPDLTKSSLRQIMIGVEYAPGPSLADRPRFLTEVDDQIRRIEDEHTQLVDEARHLQPPVIFQYLLAVQDRLTAAAMKAKRDAASEEERRQAEVAVNTQQGPPRAVPSSYLRREAADRERLREDVARGG